MNIGLDTDVLEKIEKDLSYNLEYLEVINLFLYTMGEEAKVEFKGHGVAQLITIIDDFRKLLSEKTENMYKEFGNELAHVKREFQDIDKEIAASIEQGKQ